MTTDTKTSSTPQLPSIRDAAAQLRAGTLTASDLVEHCLARVGQFESRVHAWVIVDEAGARREAQRLDQLANDNEFVGPLHGIPVAIKDLIDVAGWPTKAASPLRENSPPAADAPIVAKLRAAGTIILGKTVTTEWACFDPPPTRNPWNLAHTPGGSSSGSAAAVALEMCMAALGTQTGGSIIRPAAYCGICGLKPTFGALDMHGILPVSANLDHVGPMARTAEDVASIYAAITGMLVEPQPMTALRFGVLQSFVGEANDEVRANFEQTIDLLNSASVQVESASGWPASFAEVREHHWRIMAVEASQVHREAFATSPELFGPKVRSLIESGLATGHEDYALSRGLQQAFRAKAESLVGGSRSFVLLPSTPTPAPDLQTTGDPKFNSLWSYCGLPAVTILSGLSAGGLPLGLQLVGPPHSELKLLAAATSCEQLIARSGKLRPSFPSLG